MSILTELQMVVTGILTQVLPYAIQFIWIAVTLFVGWLVAHGLRTGVSRLMKEINLDRAAEDIGLSSALAKGELRKPASTLLGDMIYWTTVLLVVLSVVGAYHIAAPSHILNVVFGYMSKVLSATVLIGVAIYFAVFMHRVVMLVVGNVGLSYGRPLARLAQYTVIGLSLLSAVSILGIHTEWFVGSLHVLIVSLALALAISVGMGGRELASGFLTRFFKT